ncbi:MAG TPA: hypothetical protein VM536_17735, partial [Chloroflexia bacterium]|nr:hypothetical protein [Chloroflexia bacterium]
MMDHRRGLRVGVVVLLLLASAGMTQDVAAAEVRLAPVTGRVYAIATDGPYAAWGTISTIPSAPAPSGPGGPPREQSTLFAATLGADPPRAITVTAGLPAGTPFSLGDGRLAWAAPVAGAPRYAIQIYDLAAARPLSAPADPAGPGAPVLAGDWLVWAAPAPGSVTIVAQDLAHGTRRTLAQYADPSGGLATPLLLAATGTTVAWVTPPDPAGGSVLLESFDLATGTSAHYAAFRAGTPAPARLTWSGGMLFYELPIAAQAGTVAIGHAGARTDLAGSARAGSLAGGGDVVGWLPAGGPPVLVGRDVTADAPLPGALTPPGAVPSGPAALSGGWLVWADMRDMRAEAIYGVPLRERGVAGAAFLHLWQQTDQPVAAGAVTRTWVWGPAGFADVLEPFGPSGTHRVRYYDKGRMELNDPAADPRGPWYVTSGRLVAEMIAGHIATGPNTFQPHAPTTRPVAGDADSVEAPAYATLAHIAGAATDGRFPARAGALVSEALDAQGHVSRLTPLGPAVHIGGYEAVTGHNIADVFAAYLARGGSAAGNPAAPRVFDPLFV